MDTREIKLGSIVRPPRRTETYVVVDRRSYTASAHNDRWLDHRTDLSEFDMSTGKTSGTVITITTDDVFRHYDHVGQAEISSAVFDVTDINFFDFPDDAEDLL